MTGLVDFQRNTLSRSRAITRTAEARARMEGVVSKALLHDETESRRRSFLVRFKECMSLAWQTKLIVRESAIVDVEVGVEQRGTLGTEKGWLRLDPLAGLHLTGIGDQARVELGGDLGMLESDVVLSCGSSARL